MSAYLLDVNVLIALADPAHIHHDAAHIWFAREGASNWATCPITENGFVRILSNPRYPNSLGPPTAAIAFLSSWMRHPGHQFWPGEISLINGLNIEPQLINRHSAVTDAYLLALAVHLGGKLATFDTRLNAGMVKDGAQALHLI